MKDKRTYGQFCAIARALDVLGERWTLLVVRELLAGPRRFGDLVQSLPGIGTNLLAARLKDLQAADVVEKSVLPPPAASTVYSLTPRGRRLEPTIMSLGAWGDPLTKTPAKDDEVRPWWTLLLLNGRFFEARENIPRDLAEAYELHVDGEVFHASILTGRLMMRQGPHEGSTVIETDGATLTALLAQKTTFERALAKGHVTVRGDLKKLRRLARLLELPLE